jgi:hypothetical protein
LDKKRNKHIREKLSTLKQYVKDRRYKTEMNRPHSKRGRKKTCEEILINEPNGRRDLRMYVRVWNINYEEELKKQILPFFYQLHQGCF